MPPLRLQPVEHLAELLLDPVLVLLKRRVCRSSASRVPRLGRLRDRAFRLYAALARGDVDELLRDADSHPVPVGADLANPLDAQALRRRLHRQGNGTQLVAIRQPYVFRRKAKVFVSSASPSTAIPPTSSAILFASVHG